MAKLSSTSVITSPFDNTSTSFSNVGAPDRVEGHLSSATNLVQPTLTADKQSTASDTRPTLSYPTRARLQTMGTVTLRPPPDHWKHTHPELATVRGSYDEERIVNTEARPVSYPIRGRARGGMRGGMRGGRTGTVELRSANMDKDEWFRARLLIRIAAMNLAQHERIVDELMATDLSGARSAWVATKEVFERFVLEKVAQLYRSAAAPVEGVTECSYCGTRNVGEISDENGCEMLLCGLCARTYCDACFFDEEKHWSQCKRRSQTQPDSTVDRAENDLKAPTVGLSGPTRRVQSSLESSTAVGHAAAASTAPIPLSWSEYSAKRIEQSAPIGVAIAPTADQPSHQQGRALPATAAFLRGQRGRASFHHENTTLEEPAEDAVRCQVCDGVDAWGGTMKCPHCKKYLCNECFPPTQHDPCRGNANTALTATLRRPCKLLPPHLSHRKPWLQRLHESIEGTDECESRSNVSQTPIPLDLSARESLAALLEVGEANAAMLLKVRKLAEDRAARRGVQRVSARDIRDAATSLLATKPPKEKPHPTLAAEQLVWLDETLAEVKRKVDDSVKEGFPRPRVLLVCERTGTAARRWRQAGADVMTNDLEPSEDASIPHAQVPAELIQDSGFDFVYSCPPCDYLSNASVSLLHTEEGRVEAMAEAAKTFLSIYHVRAPLSVVENSKMNPYAKQLVGLSPSQIVRPFEHGHAEAKAICLYKVGDLPLLRPTFLVEERDRRLANLAPGLTRGASRGRSFDGVMAAMAAQWMGSVLAVARKRRVAGDYRSCEDLLSSIPGLHAGIPLEYTPPRAPDLAGCLKVSVLRGLTASQRAVIDVGAKTKEAETWLRKALSRPSGARAETLALLEQSQGVRLREEDPPSYAIPETRQIRCKRGIWYAWMPRTPTLDAPSGAAAAEPAQKLPNEKLPETRSLFSWQRLDKSGQEACCRIIHGMARSVQPTLEVSISPLDQVEIELRDKSEPLKRADHASIPEESTVGDVLPTERKAAAGSASDQSQEWSNHLVNATKFLTELSCGTAEKAYHSTSSRVDHGAELSRGSWAAVVDIGSALGAAVSTSGPEQTESSTLPDASAVLQVHGDKWITGLKALVRALNRKLLRPDPLERSLICRFLGFWSKEEQLLLRTRSPSFSATVDLLASAFTKVDDGMSSVVTWCPRRECRRACESNCCNQSPVTCGAWSCVSPQCSNMSDAMCKCEPSPPMVAMELRPRRTTATTAIQLIGLHRAIQASEDDDERLTQGLSMWSDLYPFEDVRDGARYRSVGQFLAVQRARLLGDEASYEGYLRSEYQDTPDFAPGLHPTRTPNGVDGSRWQTVERLWASYATWLKLQQHSSLDGALQLMPEFIAEVWPEDLHWGIREPTGGGRLWEGENLYGEVLMAVRACRRRVLPDPTPPQLMCSARGQLERTDEGRCASCLSYAHELVPCGECDLRLCQVCYSPQQHMPCHRPRLASMSNPELWLPPDCVPHASRLGRRLLSNMANESHAEPAPWPPDPPHPAGITKYIENEVCASCQQDREFCLRGLQCVKCGEQRRPSLSQIHAESPLGDSAHRPLSDYFLAGGIIAPLLLVKGEPEAVNVEAPSTAALGSVRLDTIVQILAEGVLGKDGALRPEVSRMSCITDPAGLPNIQRDGPGTARAASGAIYRFIGLDKRGHFPGSVRRRVKSEGDAAYHRYGLHHVIHTVGPDLRGAAVTRSEVMSRLVVAYGNVLRAWLSSGLPLLRLLPISGGVFAGSYASSMPQLSVEAIRHALASLSTEDVNTLRERIDRVGGAPPIQLCIYLTDQVESFTEAISLAVIPARVGLESSAPALQPSDIATVEDVMQQLQQLQDDTKLADSNAESPPTWSELRDLRWQNAVCDQVDGYLKDLSREYVASLAGEDAASEASTELAYLEASAEPAFFDEKDVSDVSSPSTMPVCCAYFEDFRVALRSKEGEAQRGFRVGAARWLSSLADTGSGNNVVSSRVLETLPADAAVEFVARPPQVLMRSANGHDVVVYGRATITFTLNGYAFRDSFMVIEQGELCILGNDFIAKRSGTVTPALYLDASSRGTVRLRHDSAPGGWMEATLVSAVGQLSQDGLSTVAPMECSPLLVSKFILEAPDRTVFCYRRKHNTAVESRTFDFPGGKALRGEDHVAAGLRELKEKLTEKSFCSIEDAVKKAIADNPEGTASGMYLAPDQDMHHTRVWVVPVAEKTLLRTADTLCCDDANWRERRLVLGTVGKGGAHDGPCPTATKLLGAYGELLARALNEEGWFNRATPSAPSEVCQPCDAAPSTVPAAPAAAEAPCDGLVASLPTSESSPEAQLLGGGGPADMLDSDAIPASQYDVGPELDASCMGETEGTLPAVPTGGKLPTDQRIKPFEYLLYHVNPIVIPPKTQTTVMLPAPKRLVDFVGPLLVEPAPDRVRCKSHLLTAYGVTHVVNGKIAVQVINNSHHSDSLPSLAPVAMVRGETITVIDQAPDTDPTGNLTPEYTKALADLHIDGICKNGCESCDLLSERRLTEEQRLAVYKLLAKRAHAFAVPPYKTPGQSHAIEVELPLKENARPFKCAASRVGDEGNQIIAQAVEDMERHHIIEKSNSPWASRVVLVKKKDGQPRFCVDLRRLNELLLVEDSPLPRCDDAIDQLGRATAKMSGAVYYHTLDLTAGFWALNIKPEHRERTAFVTNMGKWHFRRLPFGLRSGPSYMQRLMESTLQGLSWDICLPYLDDIAIWASGDTPEAAFDQALHRLDLVLERLEWAGLTCKPSKCSLFAAQVEYLGHVCSREGVSLDPKKIRGIAAIEVDSIDSLAKVKSFLGLCGYYRRHVENFHVKSAPLVALTKSGVVFPEATDNPEVKESIRQLKEALCKNPVLAYPRRDREFIVKSDAATGHGIGAVLVQRDDPDEEGQPGEERPVCFYGRKFTTHEANYSATEAELLGVVEAIRQFRPYLWGRRFRVVTDHAALKWLHTMNGTQEGGPQSRLTRWVIKLQEYNFYVEHKPGKTHVDCDAISRLVCALESNTPHSFYGKSEWCQEDVHDLLHLGGHHSQLHSDLISDAKRCLDTEVTLRLNHALSGPQVVSSLPENSASKAAKVPPRHKVRPDPPMKQFFRPLPPEEGGIVVSDDQGVPLERDGSSVSAADVKQLQREDPKCKAIMTFLTSGVMPTDARLAACVRQHARHCVITDGTLFRVVRLHPDEENERELQLLWIPESCQEAFLHAFHDQMGHQGRERTWQALRRQVFWPTSYNDVADHVMRCHECSFSKQHRSVSRGVVPALGKYPFDLVTVDLVDMVHAQMGSAKGFRKCLVFVDSLSRWVEAVALKADPTAEEYVQLFCEQVVSRYGVPRALRSDRGSNLAAVVVSAVNRAIGTKMLVSKAHHHESAASVERFNKTLEEMVRAVDPGGMRWEEWLPFLLYSYRATPHRVTSESPAYLLYGRELRGPSEAIIDTRGVPAASRQSAESTVRKLRVAWRLAEAATLQQQLADKSDRDRKMEKPPEFETDDRVLIRRENTQAKLEDLYDGPYRVVSGPDERGNYRLRDLTSRKIHDEIAVSRLKLYSTVTDVDRVAPDEYIVEALLRAEDRPLANMGPASAKVPHFLVKWRGYSLKETTWEPRSALMLRCSDMVQAFELTRGTGRATANEGRPSSSQTEPGPSRANLNQSRPERPRPTLSLPTRSENTDGLRSSTNTSSRSSRLAAQTRKNYDETRSRKATVAALVDRFIEESSSKSQPAISRWLAGRWWNPTPLGSTQFWQPEAPAGARLGELDESAPVASLETTTEKVTTEWVYVVFFMRDGRSYTWQHVGLYGKLHTFCPGGRVLATDRFYSSSGILDPVEARLQASHRILQEHLVSYPWEIKELVEQVILKTPGGHITTDSSWGPSYWWAVLTPEHFDAVPRDKELQSFVKWRSPSGSEDMLSDTPMEAQCSLLNLRKVGMKAQPDPPLTIDVLATLSGVPPSIETCRNCARPVLARCVGCLRGCCCQPNPSCVLCREGGEASTRNAAAKSGSLRMLTPVESSRDRSSSSNSMGDGPPTVGSELSVPRDDAAEALLQLSTPKDEEVVIKDGIEVFWGQAADETPLAWAVRADNAVVRFLNALHATFTVDANVRLVSKLPPAQGTGTEGALEQHLFFKDDRWWRELITFFEGSSPFREMKSRLAFCAVLGRLLWPTSLTSDLTAWIAVCPNQRNPTARGMTRWNIRVATLTDSLCRAAGIDRNTWSPPEVTTTEITSPRSQLCIPIMYVGRQAYESVAPSSFLVPGFKPEDVPSPDVAALPLVPPVIPAKPCGISPSRVKIQQSFVWPLPELMAATWSQLREMLHSWSFLEPALELIENESKTCDARLLNRSLPRKLRASASGNCYVLAQSNRRELVLRVPCCYLYSSFGDAYAHHRRALVPESWCSSSEPSDIQQFYESNFYRCSIPAAPESVVVFDVQVVRVTSRNGRILR